jgi:hypothetical protein
MPTIITQPYSVPVESQKLLLDALVNNPLHSSAPVEISQAARYISFYGNDFPSIPVNWRFAESISALKGFQGAMLNVLLKKKYSIDYQTIDINT